VVSKKGKEGKEEVLVVEVEEKNLKNTPSKCISFCVCSYRIQL
jgi:hypothetical protein